MKKYAGRQIENDRQVVVKRERIREAGQDLISVIIPVYNVENYLERCIESVICQTYKNLQIILVDDGSTDRSGEICEKYKEIDNRIVVIRKKNGGLADARNAGVDLAKGSYVGFVDSDDYVEHDMYEKMYCALHSYHVPIACCGRVDFFEKAMNRRPQKRYVHRKITCYDKGAAMRALCLYDGMDFSVCDKLTAKELFKGLRFPKGRSSEDIPVVYELYNRASGVVHIGEPKYFYCHRLDSITGRAFSIRRLDYLIFIQAVYKDITFNYPKIKKEAEVLYFRAIVSMWRGLHKDEIGRKKFDTVENRLRGMILYYLLRYAFNPYLKVEEKKWIIEELWHT